MPENNGASQSVIDHQRVQSNHFISCADGLCLSVGGQQSTSNRIVADEVEVNSDQPLLWTTTFQDGSLT